jgi:hypothetical protein
MALVLGVTSPQAAPKPAQDSQVISAERARGDSILAYRRRKVDSITALDRAAAARSRSRWDDGPFDEYTWAFYGNIAGGAIMGIVALLLRHRDATPGARRLWGVVGAMVGTFFGAVSFMAVFMFFTILSVGFSQLPVPAMFALALLATAFGIAWLMSLRFRRLGRG